MSLTSPADFAAHAFSAFIFDLDGVVTSTARVHAKAWTQAFDEFLRRRAQAETVEFLPFTAEDYLGYVDGRSRMEGVRAFLSARGIALPEGAPSDGPDAETIHGLAARKNALFLQAIGEDGVDIYPSTIALIRRLRALGFGIAVVSASCNCRTLLSTASIEHLFDVVLDGRDTHALGLAGKPAPDTFLEAARRLAVAPTRTVVVEDAIAGVEAARTGGFGLVIGLDRAGQGDPLKAAGADIVAADLADLELRLEAASGDAGQPPKPDVHRLDPFLVERAARTAPRAKSLDPWLFVHDRFNLASEGRRETLFATGNGYFVTRGAAAEARADEVHYPGAYLAGGYNRLISAIDGRKVEHEDLVNLPNWLPLTFRIGDGDWFDLRHVQVLQFRQTLDLRRGLYCRRVRMRDEAGRETILEEQRFVHMGRKHLAAQRGTITAVNWSGPITVLAGVDGNVVNAGVARYAHYNGQHLQAWRAAAVEPSGVLLRAETTQSHLRIAFACRIEARGRGLSHAPVNKPAIQPAWAGREFAADIKPGASIELTKIAALYTSRDRAISECERAAQEAITSVEDFESLLRSHSLAWEHLWRRCDISLLDVVDDAQHETHLALRLHVFHLLQTASPHSIDLDVGAPARGWHGEAYRGHVFWDELFIFPFLYLQLPMLARGLLLYRYRRLDAARRAARAAGFRGAMFPWQSGSDGREETDVAYFNPRTRGWIKDDTRLQRHVGAAVALNVWRYYQATGDVEFLYAYGAELMLEIARFWASVARWNSARGRYDIRGVLGPDEFHHRYPGRDEPGLDNNAYTNVMASWCIVHALKLFDLLPHERCRELCEALHLEEEEVVHWRQVAEKLFVPFHQDGILSQFEGYESLKEFDWSAYKRKYGNIMRLDLILDAEGDSPVHYKASKQADVLMLFYLFSAEELAEAFARLGYSFDPQSIPRTVDYYLRRTSHGSTLSAIVHAWVLARASREQSWQLFTEAVKSDIEDVQGGTTREGVHLAAMAGTLDLLQRCFTGMELKDDELWLNPSLPSELGHMAFGFRYRGHSIKLQLTAAELVLESDSRDAAAVRIFVNGQRRSLEAGKLLRFSLPSKRV